MPILLSFALQSSFVLLTAVSPARSQEATDKILDVIEEIPEERLGTWVIGGLEFEAVDETEFDLDHPARLGRLCEVEFYVEDGIAIATEIEPQDFGPERVVDGPHVWWIDSKTAEVFSFHGGLVHRERFESVEAPVEVRVPGALEERVQLDPKPPTTPPWSFPAPDRLLAVSDIEGNLPALRAFLGKAGVIDEAGAWSFGQGHLLFDGDTFDRGLFVTDTLWFILRLEREALAAGGRVHFVLGNHEAMIMAGDLRYVHLKYGFTARRFERSYDRLYAADSHVGRWLRTRNSLVKVGPLLFVHAGYSPELDALGLEPAAINGTIRAGLGRRPARRSALSDAPGWDSRGPLWYRGYFPRYAANYGPPPKKKQIESILQRHGVKHIVVGHSVVDDVCYLNEDRALIGIDVKWSKRGEAEGLLWTPEGMWRVDARGKRQTLSKR